MSPAGIACPEGNVPQEDAVGLGAREIVLCGSDEQQEDAVGLAARVIVLVGSDEQEIQIIMMSMRLMRNTGRRENISLPVAISPLSKL
jgi:hypothetical protein